MRLTVLAASLLVCPFPVAYAADTNVRVIISSDVRPGVYGRVDLGGAPPPPVVYERPMVIMREPHPAPVQPVYLHVPPGHAKDWKKHCRDYGACGVPVYFVQDQWYGQHVRPHGHDRDDWRDDRRDDRDDHGKGKHKYKDKDKEKKHKD